MIPEQLGWARTGSINSRNHLAVSEPFQNLALCGVGISGGIQEVRPRTSVSVCTKCIREARRLRVDWFDVGIENDLA